MTEPLSVLFLCTANICRSPAMELIARDLAGEAEVVFTSSGTHAHTGHRMNPVQAATIPHLDVSGFRSRRLKPEMLLGADLVLTAESIHRQHVLDDYAQLHRTLFTLGQFEAAIAEIPDLTGRELVTAVGQKRQPAHPELDIADPFRRGEKAAATITGMLRVVVPRLTGDS
jgi:protein-tyrosine-phosphatase